MTFLNYTIIFFISLPEYLIYSLKTMLKIYKYTNLNDIILETYTHENKWASNLVASVLATSLENMLKKTQNNFLKVEWWAIKPVMQPRNLQAMLS